MEEMEEKAEKEPLPLLAPLRFPLDTSRSSRRCTTTWTRRIS